MNEYKCPVLGSDYCSWLGPTADILQHCSSQHPDLVLQNSSYLTHDITRPSINTYLLPAFQVLFKLYTKICPDSGRIYYTVRHLGPSEETDNFEYTLEIKRGEVFMCRPGVIEPDDSQEIQESTSQESVTVNISSLVDVLDGFDGTTFTVTVKPQETCACGVVVSGLLYRDEDGWRCENCTPAKRACEKQPQGCTHAAIETKCKKHEWYFCEQATLCKICCKAVPEGSLSAHYDSAHTAVTYESGSAWRATQPIWQRCLVSSVAGTAVCEYKLDTSRIVIEVYTPVSSEQLSEFSCAVQLTHRKSGHTHTYTPDACYTEQYDWRIVVQSEEFRCAMELPNRDTEHTTESYDWRTVVESEKFFSDSGDFDISVDITKAGTE